MDPLFAEEINHLATVAPPTPEMWAYFSLVLQEIAGTYLRQQAQSIEPKAEGRYGLQVLVYAAKVLEKAMTDRQSLQAEFRREAHNLAQPAMTALFGGLDSLPDYPGIDFYKYLTSPDLDESLVGRAAKIGLERLPRGDYPNMAAAIAAGDLIELYERATKQRATFSLTNTGPTVGTGERRSVGASRCFLFVAAFFEIVDSDVTPLWLTGKVRTLLRERRRKARHERV